MLFRKRHQCSICAAAVCDSCSNRDLIVYIPDELQAKDGAAFSHAKLNLIRVHGVSVGDGAQ